MLGFYFKKQILLFLCCQVILVQATFLHILDYSDLF